MTDLRALLGLCLLTASGAHAADERYDAFERTIPELRAALERGEVTSEELVRQYLERIAAFDHDGPALNAMLALSSRALDEARALDAERREHGGRGPLHGIPLILKDNFDTAELPTTGGSIALAGFLPAEDATQVQRLREAGAVILGKANMHELARGITTVSSLGGQTRNPYDPERNPGGSSGGTAVAVTANYAAAGMGTDTCGSIRIPASVNNLFGLRVTHGLSSRHGIIPLSHTQDVAGPLARSVVDLAILLDVTAGLDPADPQTEVAAGRIPDSYLSFLRADALDGARIGLLSSYLPSDPNEDPAGEEVTTIVLEAVERMKEEGAEIVEVSIDGLESLVRQAGVIGFEFAADLNRYLETATDAPVHSLDEILERGLYHRELERTLRSSTEERADHDAYEAALARRETVRRTVLDLLDEQRLDALLYPSLRRPPARIGEPPLGSTCHLAAVSGLPALSLPAGFTDNGLPVGVEMLAGPFGEGELLAFAFAWESAAHPRRPPPRTPSLVSDSLERDLDAAASGAQMVPAVQSPHRGRIWARLLRPTQSLDLRFQLNSLPLTEVTGIGLHRGERGSNGPLLALLPPHSQTSVSILNEDLPHLLDGDLYLVVYTRSHPQGELRGQLDETGARPPVAAPPGGSVQ